MIKEFHSNDIDKQKWDAVVSSSSQQKVASMSWFLDAITSNDWHALILDDYVAVMPFVVNKKFGISYCYMPMYVQQFAIYGEASNKDDFLITLRQKYKYAELSLSNDSFLNPQTLTKESRTRTNFILPLDKDYSKLYAGFTKKHQASISKYQKENLSYELATDINPLLTIFREEKKAVYNASQMEYLVDNLVKIYTAAHKKGLSRLYQTKEKDEIIGGAFFIIDKHRIYYFFSVSKRRESKINGSSFILLDRLIKEYAGSNYTLDFEGSDNAGIAHFFKGFGALRESYAMTKWNDLPFFIKWMKR